MRRCSSGRAHEDRFMKTCSCGHAYEEVLRRTCSGDQAHEDMLISLLCVWVCVGVRECACVGVCV